MKAYSLRDARRLASGTKDWRRAIWNKWLVGYLTPREDEDDSAHETGTWNRHASGEGSTRGDGSVGTGSSELSPTQLESRSSESPRVENTRNPDAPGRRFDTLRPEAPTTDVDVLPKSARDYLEPSSEALDEDEDLQFNRTRRAHILRTRLDHIVSQLDALELSFQRHFERDGLAKVQDRVEQRALSDILDRLVEAQERHTQGLISCTRAVERLERRLVSLERQGLERPAAAQTEPSSRHEEVYFASSATESIVPPSMTQRVGSAAGANAQREVVAPLSGKLSEISLPTLLSMAELERWTGRLTLNAGQRTVLLDIERGLLVGVFEDDSPSDAVEALYDLVEVRDGGFSFSPQRQISKTELSPLTVGTLLLRASHRRDEMSRAEAATSG